MGLPREETVKNKKRTEASRFQREDWGRRAGQGMRKSQERKATARRPGEESVSRRKGK